MDWRESMFLHWPCDAAALRARLPHDVELDTFDGQAWLGIVGFLMTGVRVRGLPVFAGWNRFGEINVRTYVRSAGRSGVWFFSLDAAHAMTVRLGRRVLGLPYYRSTIAIAHDGEHVTYASDARRHGRANAVFGARLTIEGPAQAATPGSFEAWMAERYAFYSRGPGGRTIVGPVAHEPWPLQRAAVSIGANTLFASVALPQPAGEPHVRFSAGVSTRAYPARALVQPAIDPGRPIPSR